MGQISYICETIHSIMAKHDLQPKNNSHSVNESIPLQPAVSPVISSGLLPQVMTCINCRKEVVIPSGDNPPEVFCIGCALESGAMGYHEIRRLNSTGLPVWPHTWPNWVSILGQCLMLPGLLFAWGQIFVPALLFVSVGTACIVVPNGLIMKGKGENDWYRRPLAAMLLLVPPLVFPHFLLFLLVPWVLLFSGSVIIDNERAFHVGFCGVFTIVLLIVFTAGFLHDWTAQFMEDPISFETYTDPRQPQPGENFTIFAVASDDINETILVEYRTDGGNATKAHLTRVDGRTYSMEMGGLPQGTEFRYRIRLEEKDDTITVVDWKKLVIA